MMLLMLRIPLIIMLLLMMLLLCMPMISFGIVLYVHVTVCVNVNVAGVCVWCVVYLCTCNGVCYVCCTVALYNRSDDVVRVVVVNVVVVDVVVSDRCYVVCGVTVVVALAGDGGKMFCFVVVVVVDFITVDTYRVCDNIAVVVAGVAVYIVVGDDVGSDVLIRGDMLCTTVFFVLRPKMYILYIPVFQNIVCENICEVPVHNPVFKIVYIQTTKRTRGVSW